MLGAILGDIAGSIYEFNNTKDYNFELYSSGCEVTDDSVLTAAVASWLLDDPTHSSIELEKALVSFTKEFPNPMGGYGCTYNMWVFNPSLLNSHNGSKDESSYDAAHLTRLPYNSWGNGSAMRVSAVGWFFDTLEETERVAAISASITHNHPEGIKGAQATAAAIYMARTGADKQTIKDYIQQKYNYNLSYDYEELRRNYTFQPSCQETVPQAIWAFLESTDFEDSIRLAVSIGGDSDTLACITGGISEAFYKYIPSSFVNKALSLMPNHLIQVLKRMQKTNYRQNYSAYIEGKI